MRPVPKIICVACTDGIWDRFDFLGARGFRAAALRLVLPTARSRVWLQSPCVPRVPFLYSCVGRCNLEARTRNGTDGHC